MSGFFYEDEKARPTRSYDVTDDFLPSSLCTQQVVVTAATSVSSETNRKVPWLGQSTNHRRVIYRG